MIMLDLQYKR